MIEASNQKPMSTRPDLIPMPSQHQRGIVRWILLFMHVVPFAALVIAYPVVYEQMPELFEDNQIKLLIPAWAGLILLHFLLVAFLDVREGVVYGRREKQRRALYLKARQAKTDKHQAAVQKEIPPNLE